MLKNYFKIAFRNIFRHKVISFINIFGLAVGLTVTLLITLWAHNELSYNDYHKKFHDICRVITELQDSRIPTTPGPMAAFLKKTFPEIVNTTRLRKELTTLKYGKSSIRVEGLYTEPSFFDIFTFPQVQGDCRKALDNDKMLVLTESTAKKLFGKENPVGKTVMMANKYEFTIGGVVKDVPNNTDPPFQFEYLAPYKIYYFYRDPDNWRANWDYQTWVQIAPHTNINTVNQKIDNIWSRLVPKNEPKIKIFLQPFADVHLKPNTTRWDNGHGDIKYVYIFSILALIILSIACINFVNLFTAQSLTRTKEISIRKIIGAGRLRIFIGSFTESMLFTFIAVPFTFLLIELALPYFNQLSGKELFINYSAPWFIVSGSLIILFTGLLSGIYPALFLSGFIPSKFINKAAQSWSSNNRNTKSSIFRNFLVTGQFALAIIAIVCTLVISNQMNFIRNTNLGFDKENVIYLRMGINYNPGSYNALKTELKKLPEVANASYSNSIPTTTDYYPRINWIQNGEQKTGGFTTYEVDADYLKTMHIQLKEGRFFNKDIVCDKENAVVINESAVKALGFKKPLESEIEIGNRKAKIIGVINDFHFETLRDEIKPLFFVYEPNSLLLNIRVSSAGFQTTIKKIKNALNQQMPGLPFEWHFLDKQIEQLYQTDQRMMKVFSICAMLAIFTSCLGLFGLVTFFVQRKTKEIGIRKVVGATNYNIVSLLTKDFIKVVLIANIVAWPLAYYLMNKWLQNFAYRTVIGWWIFVLAGGIALLIAISTISFRAIKAATANPVESLRYE